LTFYLALDPVFYLAFVVTSYLVYFGRSIWQSI
jgi:hypothetical protein